MQLFETVMTLYLNACSLSYRSYPLELSGVVFIHVLIFLRGSSRFAELKYCTCAKCSENCRG